MSFSGLRRGMRNHTQQSREDAKMAALQAEIAAHVAKGGTAQGYLDAKRRKEADRDAEITQRFKVGLKSAIAAVPVEPPDPADAGAKAASDADKAPTKAAKAPEPKIELSEEQERVVRAAEEGINLLITGSAGTGKSTLLRAMRERFGTKEFPITASTGIAAVNVGGMTIHSWAGLGMGDEKPKRIAGRICQQEGKPYYRIKTAKRLALDEVSMISGKLLGTIDAVFRFVRKDPRPFGGIQMIFFGDFLQLPPVIKSPEEESHGRFAFQSIAWGSANIRTVMLTKVFRQADEEFSGALNDIRIGLHSDRAMKALRARYKPVDANPEIEPVIVHTHNQDVDGINAGRLMCLEGEPQRYQARDTGSNAGALMALQKNCLAPETLELKVGAQVMLLWNLDPSIGLANGSIGKVVKFDGYRNLPTVRFASGAEVEIEDETWDIKSDDKVLASRTQLPLRLAYAITAHKSQGMTLDKIRVHLGKCFEYGQAYVALSRARTAEGLFIEDGGRNSIKAHPDAVRFYESAQGL